jgi:hypothetical protein
VFFFLFSFSSSNFNLLYHEYRTYHSRSNLEIQHTVDDFNALLMWKATEELLSRGLIMFAAATVGGERSCAPPADHTAIGEGMKRQFWPLRMLLGRLEFLALIQQQQTVAPTWLKQWAIRGLE